jgi:UDPglucose 6-dehydrogenase
MGDLKAAVIGLGVVGKAQLRLFGGMVHVTYDPAVTGEPYPHERVAECDFAVVAVGTPQAGDGSADLSFLREALDRIPPEMPVLIRSTIPPGTMAGLEKARSLVAHMPEFLNEREDGQWRESADVPFLILGGLPAAQDFFLKVLDKVDPALSRPVWLGSGTEAELVKYTANCFLAAKVTFVNEMARVCEAFGAEWEAVCDGWLLDPRAGQSHSRVEGPGFGGRCLPKDLAALICASEEAGYRPVFLRAVEASNARFRAMAEAVA